MRAREFHKRKITEFSSKIDLPKTLDLVQKFKHDLIALEKDRKTRPNPLLADYFRKELETRQRVFNKIKKYTNKDKIEFKIF